MKAIAIVAITCVGVVLTFGPTLFAMSCVNSVEKKKKRVCVCFFLCVCVLFPPFLLLTLHLGVLLMLLGVLKSLSAR